MTRKPTYAELENRIRELEQKESEHEQVEASLRESEDILRMFVKNTPAAVAMCDRHMRYVACSDRWVHDYGLSNGDLIGKCHYEVFPDLPGHWKKEHQRCFSGDVIINEEEPFPRADGSMDWVRRNLYPWLSKSGQIGGLIMFTEVITERKHAEDALRKSEGQLLSVFRAAPTGIGLIIDRVLIKVNERICEMTGYSKEELVGQDARIFYPSDEAYKYVGREKYRQIAAHGTGTVETHWKHKDGPVVDVLLSSTPIDHGDLSRGVIFTALDITERKRNREALQASEARYKALAELLPLGIFETDDQGNVIFANESAYQLTGYGKKDLEAGLHITNVIADQGRDKMLKLYKQVLNGIYSDGAESVIQRKDGSTYHGFINARPNKDDITPGLIGYIFDLTRLKEAEEALKESEQKFRVLVEQSPLGISLIGKDGNYKYVNPRFQEMFGYTIHDCPTGNAWFKLAYPDEVYRQEVMAGWIKEHNQAKTGQARPKVYVVTCKDGSRKEIHFRPVTMDNLGQFVVYEDITKKSKMEQQLQQVQKFEAIGTLAGGIAHDFNNLLMGIQGRASLISTRLEPSHPHQEHTRAIEDYIRSATDLTKQLLGFARGGKYEVRPIDTNELVRNSSDMFSRTKKEIRVHTSFQEPPPVIAVDRNQIEQVLLNLYINAWQAMPGGGDLYLETQIATLDRAYCESYRVTPGHYAKISVTDTGAGMDSVTRQRIFDPFFTTKEKGRGTGLGLASAYGIIKNHNGIILAYSEVGQGSTFNIYLPLSDQEAFREVPVEESLTRGSETVLIVDDEEIILEVGQEMLEELGYGVLATPSGEEAIAMVKQKGSGIAMVILDLIMPGMDGSQVFDGIREIIPQMPVLLASGYAINGQADAIMQRGCNGFIQKPFNLSELSHKVRKILDEAKNLV